MKSILIFVCIFPFYSFGQIIKFRDYKKGETFKYKLTTEVYRNDKFASISISISKHTVVKNGSLFSEELSWLQKCSSTGKDTVHLDSIAKKIKPYTISLSPKGKVLLPKLTVPEMTGDITDLNTFYVAVAPALNAQKLTSNKPVFTNEKLRQGNFADSIEVLEGTDCLQVTQNLISTNKQYSVVETKFTSPSSFCLTPLADTIGRKSFEQYNNIQFVRKGEGDKVNLFWGVESFTIISKVNNANGQIIEASMINSLTLRMRYNSSRDLKTYAVEMPITIKRILKLELVN
jgi:hypothetical protein